MLVDDEVYPFLRKRHELVGLLVEDHVHATHLVVKEERRYVVEVVIHLVSEDSDRFGPVFVPVHDLEAQQIRDKSRRAVIYELVCKGSEVVLELLVVGRLRGLHLIWIPYLRRLPYLRRHAS